MNTIIINNKNEIVMEMMTVLNSLGIKLNFILNSTCGMISTLFISILAYFAGLKIMIYIIAACLFIDLILGIAVSIKNNGKDSIQSSKLRKTIIKAFFYLSTLMILFALETELQLSWLVLTKVVFGLAVLTELISAASLALILNPDFMFLRIFKKFLTQEIAKKLDIKENDIKQIIDNQNVVNKDDNKIDNKTDS